MNGDIPTIYTQTFKKERNLMLFKYKTKCSTIPVTTDMQIKQQNMMAFQSYSLAKWKNSQNTNGWPRCKKTKTFTHGFMGL